MMRDMNRICFNSYPTGGYYICMVPLTNVGIGPEGEVIQNIFLRKDGIWRSTAGNRDERYNSLAEAKNFFINNAQPWFEKPDNSLDC